MLKFKSLIKSTFLYVFCKVKMQLPMFSTLIDAETLSIHFSSPNWVIVDCRFSLSDTEAGRLAYRKSHIPGAFYAHLDEDLSGPIIPDKTGRHPLPPISRFAKQCSDWGIEEDTQVIAYDDMGGAIASRLWWMLQWLGHEKAAVLDGGWHAWQVVEGPTDDDIPTPVENKTFVPDTNPYWLVSAGFVDQIRNESDYLLVDSRAASRYAGEEEPIDPVAGHIPGAVNAPFAENWSPPFQFKSSRELEGRFENLLGTHTADNTIFYCGSGVTACHNILSMAHAGFGMAKLYAGSWSHWITDPNREIAVGED